MKRIYLIRHHKPLISRVGWFSHPQAVQFVKDYEVAVIETLHHKPVRLPYHVKKVYCSQLNRAILTAKVLFGAEVELIQNPLFNEFEQRVLRLPPIVLPISVWLTISRLLWLLGFRFTEMETFRAARLRSHRCAQQLVEYAQTEPEVVLVAHGMLNVFIRRSLRKMGWRLKVKAGNAYLGVSVLEKNA